jgi:hypothetical protein
MADINELVKKYVPKNDVPVAGEDVFFDEKNNVVRVKNAYGTSLYDPSGNLLYGKGALYDSSIGTVSGKNVQIFGRGQEIGDIPEELRDQIIAERQAKEKAFAKGGTSGLNAYLKSSTGSGSSTTSSASATGTTQAQADRQSAYDLLFAQFKLYGLESLVEPLKGLITSNISPSEFTIRLRDTDAYKQRFSANQARIKSGLRALSEAEYITLEDQYQDVMRRYGLPASYYTRGDLGKQEGFDKFISGDVSPAELEDRIQTAQNRVINAAPEVSTALKQFYPDITNGEILAYTLDPSKAIEDIKRKVTAAEIGAGAMQAGLQTGATRAEELAKFGVTGQAARQGYQAISSFLPRASQLSDIYKQGPYTQATAEQEVFGITGASDAERRRKQLAELETAQFSGTSGGIKTALSRERAGQF